MKSRLFTFVLMPFKDDYKWVYDRILQPVFSSENFEISRADTSTDQQSILKEILLNIVRADLIVADLTTKNANVFYELGIAHSFRKSVVLISQDTDNLPFDISQYKVNRYSTQDGEVEKLKSVLRNIVSKMQRDEQIRFGNPITDFLTKVPLDEEVELRQQLLENLLNDVKFLRDTFTPYSQSPVFSRILNRVDVIYKTLKGLMTK